MLRESLPVRPLPDPHDPIENAAPGVGLHALFAVALGAVLTKASSDDKLRQPWLNFLAVLGVGVVGSTAGVVNDWLADGLMRRLGRSPLSGDPRFFLRYFSVFVADAAAFGWISQRLEGRSLWRGTSRRWWTVGWPLAVVLLGGNAIGTRTAQQRAAERRNLMSPRTDLRNHSALDGDLASVMTAGARFSFVFIDLDGFKRVNDQLGHHVGDEMLQEFGATLKTRPGYAYHLSGDEFALLLPTHDAASIELELRALLSATRDIGIRHGSPLGAKFGVALSSPGDSRSGDDLRRAADAAMCRVRENGGSGAAFEGHPGILNLGTAADR